MAATAYDLTEFKEREQKLEDAYKELDQIFDLVSDAMVLISINGGVIKVNNVYVKQVGLELEQIIGHSCKDVYPGEACNTPNCPWFESIMVRIK